MDPDAMEYIQQGVNGKRELPFRDPPEVFDVEPGDVLYVPAMSPHRVSSMAKDTLSLTFGLPEFNGLDLLFPLLSAFFADLSAVRPKLRSYPSSMRKEFEESKAEQTQEMLKILEMAMAMVESHEEVDISLTEDSVLSLAGQMRVSTTRCISNTVDELETCAIEVDKQRREVSAPVMATLELIDGRSTVGELFAKLEAEYGEVEELTRALVLRELQLLLNAGVLAH